MTLSLSLIFVKSVLEQAPVLASRYPLVEQYIDFGNA